MWSPWHIIQLVPTQSTWNVIQLGTHLVILVYHSTWFPFGPLEILFNLVPFWSFWYIIQLSSHLVPLKYYSTWFPFGKILFSLVPIWSPWNSIQLGPHEVLFNLVAPWKSEINFAFILKHFSHTSFWTYSIVLHTWSFWPYSSCSTSPSLHLTHRGDIFGITPHNACLTSQIKHLIPHVSLLYPHTSYLMFHFSSLIPHTVSHVLHL